MFQPETESAFAGVSIRGYNSLIRRGAPFGAERLLDRPAEPEPDHAGVGNGIMPRLPLFLIPLSGPEAREVGWQFIPLH